MNFNASRNVGGGGGPRKVKRVSDVAAMGAPPPAGFAPPAYSPGFTAAPPGFTAAPPGFTAAPPGFAPAPAGSPPPYQEGIQLDQGFGSPAPTGDFNAWDHSTQQQPHNFMGTFAQSPMMTAQLGSMLQQPVVQDMAMQYGNQLAAQGREAVARELNKYVPVSRLRYYFAVDTRYVLKKLLLIVFPFTHKDWMVKYDQDSPVQPRYELNAPDLYIPCMGYVTYVLLCGFMLGLQQRFSPEQIGIQSSSALAYIIFEMLLYLVTLYITSTNSNLKTLDLLAYSGYKYTTMIGSLLSGLVAGRTGYYCSLLYCSLALSYFLVKSLRVQVLAGGSAGGGDPAYAPGYQATNPYVDNWKQTSGGGGGTKRRVYFLLFVAVTQPLLSWWLTCHLVPAGAVAEPLLPTR